MEQFIQLLFISFLPQGTALSFSFPWTSPTRSPHHARFGLPAEQSGFGFHSSAGNDLLSHQWLVGANFSELLLGLAWPGPCSVWCCQLPPGLEMPGSGCRANMLLLVLCFCCYIFSAPLSSPEMMSLPGASCFSPFQSPKMPSVISKIPSIQGPSLYSDESWKNLSSALEAQMPPNHYF